MSWSVSQLSPAPCIFKRGTAVWLTPKYLTKAIFSFTAVQPLNLGFKEGDIPCYLSTAKGIGVVGWMLAWSPIAGKYQERFGYVPSDRLIPLDRNSVLLGKKFDIGKLGPLNYPVLEALSRADGSFPGGKKPYGPSMPRRGVHRRRCFGAVFKGIRGISD